MTTDNCVGADTGDGGPARDELERAIVDALSRRSGATEDEVRSAGDLFEEGVLNSHSVTSVAVDLQDRFGIELLDGFQFSDWMRLDKIVNLLQGKGARP